MTTPPAEQAAAEGVTEDAIVVNRGDSFAVMSADKETVLHSYAPHLISMAVAFADGYNMRRASPRASPVSDERVRDALMWVLPMAKAWAHEHPVGGNQDKCDSAAEILTAALSESKKDLPT